MREKRSNKTNTNKKISEYCLDKKYEHARGLTPEEETDKLSSIIERINERFGTQFTHLDKIINEMETHMREHEDIKEAARNNTYDNYKYSFSPKLKDFIIGNIEVKEEYLTLLEEPDALAIIDDYLGKKVYTDINKQP